MICAELRRSQQSVDAMKKQSDGLRTEYDRLSEEHARLQVGCGCVLVTVCTEIRRHIFMR